MPHPKVFRYNLPIYASLLFAAQLAFAVPTQLAITSVNGGTPPTYGTAFSVTVESQDGGGSPDNVAIDTDVILLVNTGSGTVGGTTNGTILAGTSSVVISGVMYSQADTGVVFTGSRTSGEVLTDGNSSSFDVNPVNITVTSGLTADNKVYDGTTDATLSSNTVVLAGVVTGDESNVDLSTNGYTASFADANAGIGKTVTVTGLTLTGTAAGNYTLTQPTLSADVSKAPATMTITNLSQTYDRTGKQVGASTAPVGGLTVDFTYDGSTDAPTNVGSYEVIGTVNEVNYEGSATNTLVVDPAVLIVTNLLADDKVYDSDTNATISAGSAGLDGVYAGDTVNLVTNGYEASFADKNADTNKAVTISGLSLAGADSFNYVLSQPVLDTADITPKPVTVSGIDAEDKVFDNATTAVLIFTNVSISGVIPGDDVTLDTNSAAGNFASVLVGQDKVVNISGLTLGGGDAANYDPAIQATTTANIWGLWLENKTYSMGDTPRAACLANLRGLGTFRDLCVADYSNNAVNIRLCLDNGLFSTTMYSYPVDAHPAAIDSGELYGNKDYEDLVTANQGTNTVSVLVNHYSGILIDPAINYVIGSTPNPGPVDLQLLDLNSDNRKDIAVANFNENTVSVLTNRGGAIFAGLQNLSVGSGPSGLCLANMDNQNDLDIITANRTAGTLSIIYNSNAVFSAAQTIDLTGGGPSTEPTCVRAGDLNNDGIRDLVVANYLTGTISVLLGEVIGGAWDAASQDDYTVGANPRYLVVRDINRDGILDIACVDSGDGTLHTFLGVGNGTFTLEGIYAVGSEPIAIHASNFNNSDKANDLAIVDAGGNQVYTFLFIGALANAVTQKVYEDTPTNITLIGKAPGGGPLIYEVVTPPTNGIVTGSGAAPLYTPDADYFGPDFFTYHTIDSHSMLTSTVATVTINVIPVNDQPSFSLVTNVVTVLEDAKMTNIYYFTTNLVAGPDNETNQTFSYTVTTTNNAFFAVRPKVNSAGTLIFKPKLNVIGSTTVQVQAKDSGGTLFGGTNLSLPQELTIVVEPHPLKPHRGIFTGLFYATNGVVSHYDSGFFTFTMTKYGRMAGYVRTDGGKRRFTGQFDLSGFTEVSVEREFDTLTVDFQLELTNGTDQVTGIVTNNSATIYSGLIGDRAIYNTLTNPCPLAGSYTLVFPGNDDSAVGPGGDSFVTLTVLSNGVIKGAGRLSEGSTFSQSVRVSKNGDWPFYVSLLGGQGSVFSWLAFTNLPSNTIEGNVSWIKPASGSKYYPGGFTNFTAAMGSPYVVPAGVEHIITTTNNQVTLEGGNIPFPVAYSSSLTDSNIVLVGASEILGIASPTSGRMSGTFAHPISGLNRTIQAVPLQQQNVIRGYFLDIDVSGSFLLTPTD